MAGIKLDLSQFKHVKSDKNTTTLQHRKGGHQLTLMHKALSPDNQEQLSALAKLSQSSQTPQQTAEIDQQKMAKGGNLKRKKMSDGGETDEQGHPKLDVSPEAQQAINSQIDENRKENVYVPDAQKKTPDKPLYDTSGFSDGGEVDEYGYPKDTSKDKPLYDTSGFAKGGPIPNASITNVMGYGPIGGMAKGGKARKMYADGSDQVVSDEDLAPGQPMTSASQVSSAPIGNTTQVDVPSSQASAPRSEDPEMVRKQKEAMSSQMDADSQLNGYKNAYNQMLSSSGSPVSADDMFGPNGEPPRNPINSQLWAQAQSSNDTQNMAAAEIGRRKALVQSNDIIQKQEAEHEQAQAQNAIYAQLGVPNRVPDPGAPQLPQDQQQASGMVAQDQSAQPSAQQLQPENMTAQDIQAQNPNDLMGSYQNALNYGLTGIQQEMSAKQQLAQDLQKQHQTAIDANAAMQQSFKDSNSELNQERLAHIQDIKDGYIDPEQYWNDHSKLATGIGIILAGFNPSNNPNAALNFLKFQMEQNLNAQAHNLGAKENLLSANIQQFGNVRAAADMTRVMQSDYVQHLMDQAAARAGTPMAQAQSNLMKSQLYKDFAPIMMRASLFRTVQNLQQQPNGGMKQGQSPTASVEAILPQLRLYAPDLAKQVEDHMIPGVGAGATQVVPQEVRDRTVAMKNLNDRLIDLQSFVRQHPVANNIHNYQAATQKAAEIGALYSQSLGGSMTEGRISWLDEQIAKHPTSLPAYLLDNSAKLQEIKDSNLVRMNNTLNSVGLKVPQSMQPRQLDNSPQAALRWAQANPNDPRAQDVLAKAQKLLGR